MTYIPRGRSESLVRPRPITPTSSQSSRSAQPDFEGAAYWLDRPMTVNRLIWAITSRNQDPTGLIGVYQTDDGSYAQSIPKVASIASFDPVIGQLIVAPDEGTVEFVAGLLFVLVAEDVGGNFGTRTYSAAGMELFNTDMPNVAEKFMGNFSTNKAATSGIPASFDPRETGDGGDCTPTTSDTGLLIAFAEV